MNVYSLPIVDSKAYQYYLQHSSTLPGSVTEQRVFTDMLKEEVYLNTEGFKYHDDTELDNFNTLVYKMSSSAIPGPVKLPTGYTELAYIESTGTQWIDTGINPTNKPTVDITFAFTKNEDKDIFGNNNINGSAFYGNFGSCKLNYYRWVSTTSKNVPNSTVTLNTIHNWNLSNTVYLDNVLLATYSDNYVYDVNQTSILIFAAYRNNKAITNKSSIKLYSFKLYNGDKLVFNGIPCTNPNDEAGLYDTVSKRFFGNSGTGSFIAGELKKPDVGLEYISNDNAFDYAIRRSVERGTFHNLTIYVDDNPNDFVSVLYNDSSRYTGKEHLTASLANLYNNSGKIYFETVPYRHGTTYYNGIWDDNNPGTEEDFTYEADMADTHWNDTNKYYTYDYNFYTANTIYEQSSYWKREGITTHTYNNAIDSQIDGKAYFTGSKIYAAKAFSNTVPVLERITNISRTIPNHIFIDSYRYTKPYNFLGYFPQNDVGNWSTNTYNLIHWDLDDPDMYNPAYFPAITIVQGTKETDPGTIDIENNSKLKEHIFNDSRYCDLYEVVANIYDTRPQLAQYNKEFLVSSVHFMNTYNYSLSELQEQIDTMYGRSAGFYTIYKPDDTDPYIADELDTYYTASYNFSISEMAGEGISNYHRRILGDINDWAQQMCQFPKSYYISISAYFDEGYFPTFNENITGKTSSIVVESIRDWQEQFDGIDGYKYLPIRITITEKIDDNFIYVDRYILVTNDTVEFTDDEGMISTTSEHTVQNGILHII